ncbi:MAG TPA: pyridoxal phosphate-dependent aminotransferase [Candidatus Thermoplasmatota archaeon]|nr:pyridoxal phosphate-dependent aminotransferase [Candidatus Thermoplasmatota archaeon]
MRSFHARRLADVEPSGTVKLQDVIARLKSQGREIVSLSVGEPDFATPKHVREAAKKALDEGHTHYTSSFGIPTLREAVADKHRKENGIPAEPKHVLVTPAKQAVFMAMLATLDEGDEVLLPDPAWVSYEPIARMCGARPVPVPVSAHRDYRMLPEDVARAVTPKTKMIVLNSPSNPTGGVATDHDVKGLADLAVDKDLLVLSDELYEKILYEGRHVSPASLPGMFERTITVNGLSKSFAMTGWRLGWAVAPEPLLAEMSKIQQHSITHCATFAQHAAVAALRGSQRFVEEMRTEFLARRDLVVNALNATPGFNCVRPKGAFYVFPSYSFGIPSEDLALFLLENAGVAVTPGSAFGANGEGHLRISYANSRENLQKGLAAIAEAVPKLAS